MGDLELKMRNPIITVLNEKNMSSGELAVLSGTDGGWVRQLRLGYPSTIGTKVIQAVVSLGYDREWLVNGYSAWRKELSESLRTKYKVGEV